MATSVEIRPSDETNCFGARWIRLRPSGVHRHVQVECYRNHYRQNASVYFRLGHTGSLTWGHRNEKYTNWGRMPLAAANPSNAICFTN